jgi:hypothetical protein
LLWARIVVFIAMTSAATTRLRSPDPASESYPPGFELGSPVKKARASVRPLSTSGSPRAGREQSGDPVAYLADQCAALIEVCRRFLPPPDVAHLDSGTQVGVG